MQECDCLGVRMILHGDYPNPQPEKSHRNASVDLEQTAGKAFYRRVPLKKHPQDTNDVISDTAIAFVRMLHIGNCSPSLQSARFSGFTRRLLYLPRLVFLFYFLQFLQVVSISAMLAEREWYQYKPARKLQTAYFCTPNNKANKRLAKSNPCRLKRQGFLYIKVAYWKSV